MPLPLERALESVQHERARRVVPALDVARVLPPGPGLQVLEVIGDGEEVDTLAAKDPVIVLPIAAIEQHGPHLPLSTDLEIGLGVLAEAFRQLDSEAPIWTLPIQTIGTSIEHLGFAGTLSLDSELLVETIVQLGAGVARSGVRRLVISNSHGALFLRP